MHSDFDTAAAVDPLFPLVEEVAAAYAAHGSALHGTLFVDLVAGRIIHPNTDIYTSEQWALNANRSLCATLNHYRCARTSDYHITGGKSYVMIYRDRDTSSPILGPDAGAMKTGAFTFDHELGHALTREKQLPAMLSESIADAYAMLRHYQRFGIESDMDKNIMSYRRQNISFDSAVENGLDYYTIPTLRHIAQHKHAMNLDALSPQETFALAEQTARDTIASPEIIDTLRVAYTGTQLKP